MAEQQIMNILILSDLHLSNNDSFSTFGWNEEEFLFRLDLACTMYSVDQIILNGDLFELCKYTPDEIVNANGRLLRYFALNKAVYIRGNHDYGGKAGIGHYDIVNSPGTSIHIEHGHKADFFGGTRPGRFLNDSLFAAMKRLFSIAAIRKLYFGILSLDEGLHHSAKYNSYPYLRYAQKLLEVHDVVILGHTHKMEEHRSFRQGAAKVYLNSGTCTLGRFQALVMDTETLHYEMIRSDRNDLTDDAPGKRRRLPQPVKGPMPVVVD